MRVNASGAPHPAGVKSIFVSTPEEFRAWLEERHSTESDVSVGYWKKGTSKPSLTWSEAVEQALCFRWIDGRANTIDDERWKQRLQSAQAGQQLEQGQHREGRQAPEGRPDAPRRPGRSRGAERGEVRRLLLRAGRAGEAAARLREAPARERRRLGVLDSTPPSYRRTATHWVVSAKREETRERRLDQLIESSAAGLHIPPLHR